MPPFVLVSALLLAAPAAATVPAAPVAPAATEMTQYFMVFLRRGPAWTSDVTPETRAVSRGHMANIEALTQSGKMVVAGPFDGTDGDDALTGIFILRVASMEEAEAAVKTDPAVVAGRFIYEILPWWGPASLTH